MGLVGQGSTWRTSVKRLRYGQIGRGRIEDGKKKTFEFGLATRITLEREDGSSTHQKRRTALAIAQKGALTMADPRSPSFHVRLLRKQGG